METRHENNQKVSAFKGNSTGRETGQKPSDKVVCIAYSLKK